MTYMMTLTQLLACAVTFKMDIAQAAILLRNKIEKIDLKLSKGSALSDQKIAQLKQKQAGLVAQLKAVLAQL